MQLQSLRREASSKLMLFTIVSMLLLILALPVYTWFVSDSIIETALVDYFSDAEVIALNESALDETALSGIVKLFTMILTVPVIAFLALPLIAMFLIYKNARSERPMKCAGFSILRGYMIANIVIDAFLLSSYALDIRESYPSYSLSLAGSTFEMLLKLLTAIFSLGVLNAAREVIRFGGTNRRVTRLLPTLMIASAVLSAVELLLTVLANTVPSLVEKLGDYRIETAEGFYAQIAVAVLLLAKDFLFILLCFRGLKALSSEPETPFFDDETNTP